MFDRKAKNTVPKWEVCSVKRCKTDRTRDLNLLFPYSKKQISNHVTYQKHWQWKHSCMLATIQRHQMQRCEEISVAISILVSTLEIQSLVPQNFVQYFTFYFHNTLQFLSPVIIQIQDFCSKAVEDSTLSLPKHSPIIPVK